MHVLIWEYVCGGGFEAPQKWPTLMAEGRAMLSALVRDAALLPDVSVSTLWHESLGTCPLNDCCRARNVSAEKAEAALIEQARKCDRVVVIAPEFDDILAGTIERLRCAGCHVVAPDPETVRLCADKLRFADHCVRHDIPTIPTRRCDGAMFEPGDPYPLVVKPRDGAGSLATWLVRSSQELLRCRQRLREEVPWTSALVQPYVAGTPASVAVVTAAGRPPIVFPPALQHLSRDGRFRYLGGTIPATADAAVCRAVQELACRVTQSLPGLVGYVGIDVILPADDPTSPIVVEVNPRLTTSYLGYRRLAKRPLADHLLKPESAPGRIVWRSEPVSFRPDELE